ncbi:MAG: 2-dehydropantoate 2-reductase [Acidimicrobiales bacterium]
MTAPEIAVVGPGGVGTFFAAHLAAAGHRVVACARRPFSEYIVESDRASVTAPATVATDPAQIEGGPVPWVLVGVKAHQTDGAAPWFERLCGPGTTIVVMQNGVEGAERLAPHAHGADIVPTVVYCGTELVAPGHTVHARAGHLFTPDVPAAHRLAELFADTLAEIRPTAAYVDEAWRKLGLNVVVNGLTALTDRPIAVVADEPLRTVARGILAECWAVGRAEGSTLTDDGIEPLLTALGGAPGITSMLQDRRAGRATEHDALYGAVVRGGLRHGIPTPLNQAVGALLAGGDPA